MRFLKRIALGPAAGNTVGIYSVIGVPERKRIYCSNLHTPWLTIIDTAQRAVTGIVCLEEREQRGLMETARHPLTDHIYVSNELKACLYVVDPGADRLETVVDTLREPHYADFDPPTGRMFIACGGDNAVLVLDARHRRLGALKVGAAPWGIATDPLRRRLYVVCQGDATLWRLHLDGLEPVGPPAKLGRMPRCAAIDPLTGNIFVGHRRERRLFVFPPDSLEPLARLDTEFDSIGVTFDPRFRRVYVVNRMGKLEEEIGQPATVSVIDAEALKTLRHVPVGKISHYLALDDRHAYVTNEDSLDVSVLDRVRMEEIGRIGRLGQTVDDLAIHRGNGRVYIPSHLTDDVIVADPESGRAVARPIVGSWPSGAAVDSRRGLVYVTNMDNGTLTVLSDASHARVAEIDLGVGTNKIHRLWSRVAVDEQRRKIYVTLTRFNGLAVIDGETGRVEHRVRLGEENPDLQSAYVRAFEFGLSVDQSTGLVWVLNGHRARLSAVDPAAGKVAGAVDLGILDLPLERRFSPFSMLAAHPRLKRVYAYNWIVSTETMRVQGMIPREIGTGVTTVDEARNLLYVHGVGGLTAMDAVTFARLDFLPLEAEPGGEPSEVRTFYGVDLARKRVYAVRHIMLRGNELEVYEAPS
jgi:DNA-binding beta-propeller fold protein YncE